jgi:membrane protein DedA with SNARE-associated domain
MDSLAGLFGEYGLPMVFAAVFLEQLGPPVPSGPLLIVAGALASDGQVSWPSIAGVTWLACMLGNVLLYIVGRRYGREAMSALCRLSVSPNSRADKTEISFERWGPALLIVAALIPGARTLAPSLAGADKLRPVVFLIYSALGAALWTGLYLAIGLVFHSQIREVLIFLERSGKIALVLVAAAIVAYLIVKWWRRRRSVETSG